jgi:hypothetical protein
MPEFAPARLPTIGAERGVNGLVELRTMTEATCDLIPPRGRDTRRP